MERDSWSEKLPSYQFRREGVRIGGRNTAQEIRAEGPERLTDGTVRKRLVTIQLDAHTGPCSHQGSHRTHLRTRKYFPTLTAGWEMAPNRQRGLAVPKLGP